MKSVTKHVLTSLITTIANVVNMLKGCGLFL